MVVSGDLSVFRNVVFSFMCVGLYVMCVDIRLLKCMFEVSFL